MLLRSGLPSLSAPKLLLAAALWGHVVNAQSNNISLPTAAPFFSRPDLDSVVLNVTLNNDTLVSPGYIFLAPYQVGQAGPYIFDNSGNLVWSGFGVAGPAASHDFRVCPYNGSDHLCMFQGSQLLGYARGHGLIMDASFAIVKSVQTGGGLPPADQHEFYLINEGKTALMVTYRPLQHDLTSYNVINGQGWIMEGVFQEVDTQSSEVLFEWHSLNHVDPSESSVLPNTTLVAGDGLTKNTPWDYFHLNSVDKNSEGDYLISARHTSGIYKVSGSNGSVIWRLGGKQSSFQLAGNLNFSSQHDARFVAENSTTTIISMFDNASDGVTNTANFSEGKLIAINNETMTATLLQTYGAPDPLGGLLSASQGNLQQLPNGNAFIGWGSNAFISESTADGTPIFYARLALTGALHYRSFKFNFTSTPSDRPALYTYALDDSASTAYYVSWNGATEVASWSFYSGSAPDNLTLVGNTRKNGFETVGTQPSYYAWTVAEAVASNGSAIRNSTLVGTFVPGSGLAQICTDIQCPLVGGYLNQPEVLAMTMPPPAPPTTSTAGPSETPTAAAKRNAGLRREVGSQGGLYGLAGVAALPLLW